MSFKYPANIVGKICPPWPPPQCHEFCRILWAHWCSHLVAPMFPSNQGGFPSPFCFFFSPRTTFKGHVKKHTGISLVISPPNPKKRGKRGYPWYMQKHALLHFCNGVHHWIFRTPPMHWRRSTVSPDRHHEDRFPQVWHHRGMNQIAIELLPKPTHSYCFCSWNKKNTTM